jgi:ParB family transcriptional regulator, chromosome partitioning protein
MSIRTPLRKRVEKARPIATLATNARVIPIESIGSDPDQPRREMDEEALERLASSLKARGQLQPIRVRWDEPRGQYVIVCGERRWRAAMLAGLVSLTAIVEDRPLSPVDLIVIQMIENCVREDLPPLDQARAMRSLIDRGGWTQERLATEIGVSPSTVCKSLALLELPAIVRDLVVAGELSASVARELARIADPKVLEIVTQTAVACSWTRSQAAAAARSRGAPLDPEEASPNSLEIARGNILSDAGPVGKVETGPPADYLVKCNACSFTKKRSAPGGCPEGHDAGFSYLGKIALEGDPDVRACRVCGCTEDDCRQCVEKTGEPCHWVEDDLCSACVEEDTAGPPWTYLVRNQKGLPLYLLKARSKEQAERYIREQHPADFHGHVEAIGGPELERLPKWITTNSAEGAKPSPVYGRGKEAAIVPATKPPAGEGRDVPASSPKVPTPAPAPLPKKEQLVFGFTSDEDFEIVITRTRPWTGQEILAAVWELKVKLERQYLKP